MTTSAVITPSHGRPIRTVFLAAPAHADTSLIRTLLKRRGIEVLDAKDSPSGPATVGDAITNLIRKSDLLVGVMSADRSPNVMLECGVAHGLGKRVVLFLPPSIVELPIAMSGALYFRLDPS